MRSYIFHKLLIYQADKFFYCACQKFTLNFFTISIFILLQKCVVLTLTAEAFSKSCNRKRKMDVELDRFKSEISLVAYAESQGYQIDRKLSSKHSVILRLNDDKIVVSTSSQGHGIYFSVRNDSDHGTIIDFIQKRQKLSLGQIRQKLRCWNPSPFSYRPESFYHPLPAEVDQQSIVIKLSKMLDVSGYHEYLIEHRKISSSTLSDKRFSGVIKTDERNNAVFPHFDRQGVCGYEVKNTGFTGFSKSGQKAFWITNNFKSASCIVIVESAIDALSHAQLHQGDDYAYVSIAGTLSEKQRDLMRSLLTKAMTRNIQIVVATDNDEPGEKYYSDIVRLSVDSVAIKRDVPICKDWNEYLL